MSKRTHRVVTLDDYKEKKADEGAIDVKLRDGTTFRIPPPELWPDEATRDAQEARRTGDLDLERSARLIVGDKEFDRFVANGGSATLFHSLLTDEHQAATGESSAS